MLTYSAANKILDGLVARTSVLFSNVYIGLSTTVPSRDGTGYTEPPQNAGYKRSVLGIASQSATQIMGGASSGGNKNSDTVYFPEATGDWGTCTHYLLFSSATGTDLIAYGALTNSIKPVSGTVPLIRANELQMTLS